ncbi:hypothetical protein LX69_02642 [Breznakibacter xylanolyticus]|uniref:Tetratricopeptide repeat protein n=1 Tax=Breznakibacter xylanolyticus TaxID=990 RepID=A0A2W7N0Q0_9BACT|nr:hypothetical protein [Breznakibacter xylanolyticus]MBN2743322.1 hypothetical protein [Marinilabiliaceae bacterium]PZX13531.1 hypothetical protein LX69_02642 [Breznakibacter xylanolyticus]
MKLYHLKPTVIASVLTLLLSGCATYYQKNLQFQEKITTGNYTEANKMLDKSAKEANGKNRVLYYFDKGVVEHMLGNFSESNRWFQKADLYVEDYSKNLGMDALALMTNPGIKPYKPEDFEGVMIHFYQTLNYLFLKNYESALIECRRLNIQLNRLNDKYKNNKNKYAEDAFGHHLMGMIYEASGDANNAFIAYRNAVNCYESVYKPVFGMDVPQQLKHDVIRAAYKTGFGAEALQLEQKFNIKTEQDAPGNGTLVFFWMNGMGPVKSEWSLNFINSGAGNGFITLADAEAGVTFPIFLGNYSQNEQSALKNLSALRIAFPKYQSRPAVYSQGSLLVNNTRVPLQLSQDINAIAFQSLKDRMLREIGTSIARLAVKKAMEEYVRSQNKDLGAVLSIVNALTEKADTRNWQTLPSGISYARVSLPPGTHNITLEATGAQRTSIPITVTIEKGKTTFYNFHNL